MSHKIKLITVLIFLIGTFIVNFTSANTSRWKNENLLINEHNLSQSPSIAVSNNSIYVVWHTITENKSKICCRISRDNGITWGSTINITTPSGKAFDPSIAVHNNTVHIAWKDFRNGYPEIYYKKSEDGGKTWTEDKRLTYNSSRKNNIYDIKIVAYKNNIYVVWRDYRTGSSELFFKKSTDNGNTWSEDIRLTNDYSPSYHPSMAVSNKKIHIVWEDYTETIKICYIRSNDNGNNWTEKKSIVEIGKSKHPCIIADDNTLHIVWENNRDGNWEIYYKKSEDGGKTWTEDKRLTYTNSASIQPKIAIEKNTLHVVWTENLNYDQSEIFYKISYDNGKTWSNITRVTSSENISSNPSLSTSNKTVHLVWQEYQIGDISVIKYKQKILGTFYVQNINFSATSIQPGQTINIYVYGYDKNNDNLSLLKCRLQYRLKDNQWENLETNFVNDHWEAKLLISQSGVYDFRAKLIDINNEESSWFEVFSVVKVGRSWSSENTTILIFSAIIIMTLLLIILKKIKGR